MLRTHTRTSNDRSQERLVPRIPVEPRIQSDPRTGVVPRNEGSEDQVVPRTQARTTEHDMSRDVISDQCSAVLSGTEHGDHY